jgi:hypothetical protein
VRTRVATVLLRAGRCVLTHGRAFSDGCVVFEFATSGPSAGPHTTQSASCSLRCYWRSGVCVFVVRRHRIATHEQPQRFGSLGERLPRDPPPSVDACDLRTHQSHLSKLGESVRGRKEPYGTSRGAAPRPSSSSMSVTSRSTVACTAVARPFTTPATLHCSTGTRLGCRAAPHHGFGSSANQLPGECRRQRHGELRRHPRVARVCSSESPSSERWTMPLAWSIPLE